VPAPIQTIVLTGGRAPVALDLARHFAAAGCRVVVAESLAFPLTRASRAVARSVRVPPPRQRPEAFLDAVDRLVHEEGATLVVPTCEETFVLSRGLAHGLPVFTSAPETLARLHDKGRFALAATAAGIAVPETHRLASREALVPFLTDAWVLKPAFSRFGTEALVPPHGVRRLAALRPSPERPTVAQRFVAGRPVCTYSVAHTGRIVAHASYGTPYVAGHAGVWFRAETHPAAFDVARRLVAAERFTGQIALDLIETPDGRVQAIECNPRATSGLHLFRGDPAFSRAFLDPEALAAPVTPSGRDAMLAGPMLAAGAAHGFDAPWRAAFASARDAAWDAADPWPACGQVLTAATFLARALRHRISPLAATTYDIEWNGE
jgi:hypothetical protein